MIRKAKAVWRGTGRAGSGNLSTDSGVLAETPYSFKTRFENEKGTNPEELIAAAHAGCFTMALAFGLQGAGYTPSELSTEAAVTLDPEGLPHQSVGSDSARQRAEPRRSHIRSDGRRRREELPGFQGPQCRDHTGRQAALSCRSARRTSAHATFRRATGRRRPCGEVHVVTPMTIQHYMMLQRNLLYTGVTRGKRLVILLGQKKAVAIAVKNVSGRRRWSKLHE
jgi:organic hydroperoxide reductase OsmC/OhrA